MVHEYNIYAEQLVRTLFYLHAITRLLSIYQLIRRRRECKRHRLLQTLNDVDEATVKRQRQSSSREPKEPPAYYTSPAWVLLQQLEAAWVRLQTFAKADQSPEAKKAKRRVQNRHFKFKSVICHLYVLAHSSCRTANNVCFSSGPSSVCPTPYTHGCSR
jgi:fucose permease